MNNNNQFNYTYSAPTENERREIEDIRRRYQPKIESKLERVRKLDAKVKGISTAVSLIIGVLGCLLFGTGITCFLEWERYLLGSLCGMLGAIAMIVAYPVFGVIDKTYRKKYTDEILQLTNELLDEEKE